jgi:hypothetical protein
MCPLSITVACRGLANRGHALTQPQHGLEDRPEPSASSGGAYGSSRSLLELSRSLPISSSAGRISRGRATSEPAWTS